MRTDHWKRSVLLVFTCLLCVVTHAQAVTHEVTVFDIGFEPAFLVIEPGDTVRWVNAAGGMNHDVTADDFSFASQTATSFTFEMTFDDPGMIPYHCTVHSRPASDGGAFMNGTIVVQGAAATGELRLNSVTVLDRPIEPFKLVDVETRVRNTGDETASGWTFDIYLSEDEEIETTDTLLGTGQGDAVNPGEVVTQVTNVQVPDIDPGPYFIGVIVNFEDGNAANNVNLDPEPLFFGVFVINAGINDAWFNPDTNGQGFFIIVFEDIPLVFLAWFTYDTDRPPEDVEAILGDPGHRWITAQGPFAGDTAVLDLVVTRGGIFNSGEPEPENEIDGTITIEFESCTKGVVKYNIPSLGLMGEVPIQRIANDNVALCEELSAAAP